MAKTAFAERLTNEDLEFIESHYGSKRTELIAEHFNVSARTIEKVAEAFEFGGTKVNQGIYSVHQLAKAFGVSSKVIKKWHHSTDFNTPLPLKKLPAGPKSKKIYDLYGIKSEPLWTWVRKNLERVDLRKYERSSIVPEPLWLDKEILKQKETFSPIDERLPWTVEEDKQLLHMRLVWRLSYKEITERLNNRTKTACEKRIKRLRKQQPSYYKDAVLLQQQKELAKKTETAPKKEEPVKPVKSVEPVIMKTRDGNWTEEEDWQLLDLYYNKELLHKEITAIIGRTVPSIESRLLRLRKMHHPFFRYRKWTDKEDKRLIKLKNEGYSHREIGDRLGRPRNGVSARYNRLMNGTAK